MTSPTPEHDRRAGTPNSGEPMHPEVLAAYAYVGNVAGSADVNAYGSPAWYGWALREAFLAGCTHAQTAAPLTDDAVREMLQDTREVFGTKGTDVVPGVAHDVIEYVASWLAVYADKRRLVGPGVAP